MAPPKKDDVGGDPGNNGWNAWANHVLLELKRLNGSIESLNKEVGDVRLEIAQLKVKSGIWGGIAGMASIILVLGGNYLKNIGESKVQEPTPVPYHYQHSGPTSSIPPASPTPIASNQPISVPSSQPNPIVTGKIP